MLHCRQTEKNEITKNQIYYSDLSRLTSCNIIDDDKGTREEISIHGLG
jgi:hypothetical protein